MCGIGLPESLAFFARDCTIHTTSSRGSASLPNSIQLVCAGEQLVSERDKSIRAAALGTLEILHGAEGSAAAWRVIGSISSQQRSLIEERFRHSEKQAARATAASRQATGSSASSSQRTTDDAEVPYGRCRPCTLLACQAAEDAAAHCPRCHPECLATLALAFSHKCLL